MGKFVEKVRTYKKEWESQPWAKGWLTRADKKFFNEAYCKICEKDLRAHRSDLEKHATTSVHLRKMENMTSNKQKRISSEISIFGHHEKERDLKFAAYIANQCSIKSIDHLCDLLVNLGKGSSFANFKMHRTKCGNLIKYVIAPCMLSDLIADVGDKYFSLIVDESTDISSFKYLCLCIKYFSEKVGRIITDYLGIILLEKATAQVLYDALVEFAKNINLKLENIIGLGTDGGTNLCSKDQSLYSFLKQKISTHIQLVKCINHHNAASHAATEFPATINFLCTEVYNWFSHSSLRKLEYRRTWDPLNPGHLDNNGKSKSFPAFISLSDTRWLVQFLVVNNLLEHWFELQTHFRTVVTKEKCYTARLLNQMLDDDVNVLYLKFLKPILYEVNHMNKIFQTENLDLARAVEDLKALILLEARKIVKPTFLTNEIHVLLAEHDNELAFLKRGQVDFGIEYYQALQTSKITIEQKIELETRAFAFLKRLFSEMAKRFPENLKLFQGLKAFSPHTCLNQNRPDFKELPLTDVLIDKSKLSLVESQCNKLLSIDWPNQSDSWKKVQTFWPHLYLFEDAAGNFTFRDLALYVLKLLSLPSSNAVVERVFFVMKTIISRLRNKMGVPMLDSLLRIRCRFHATNTCCSNFIPTHEMYQKFNYKVVYPVKDNSEEERINDEIFEILDDLDPVRISIPEF